MRVPEVVALLLLLVTTKHTSHTPHEPTLLVLLWLLPRIVVRLGLFPTSHKASHQGARNASQSTVASRIMASSTRLVTSQELPSEPCYVESPATAAIVRLLAPK